MVDPKSLTAAEVAFLKSLPVDGTHREVSGADLSIAHMLHLLGLCFLSSGDWPNMIARTTFDTRKVLARLE